MAKIVDIFHPENSHVVPAVIKYYHGAKASGASKVAFWGTGKARREFLHVEDMAETCVFLLENCSDVEHVNVGNQQKCTIMNMARFVARGLDFGGEMDSGKLFGMGWKPGVEFEEGLQATYRDFCARNGAGAAC